MPTSTGIVTREVAKLAGRGQIQSPVSLSIDPKPKAELQPEAERPKAEQPEAEQPEAEQPAPADRRSAHDRRTGERRRLTLVPQEERRVGESRRRVEERRVTPGLRDAETAEEHVRNALQLLMTIAETESLDDEVRRDLDAAIFRLHFAIERLQRGNR
jgi:hypothetical protein